LQKKGVITRKPGQTTKEALAARRLLFEQRAPVIREKIRLKREIAAKRLSGKIYTKEEIAQYVRESKNRAPEIGRTITINRMSRYEPRKYKGEQHN
jgi:hypothetical protein